MVHLYTVQCSTVASKAFRALFYRSSTVGQSYEGEGTSLTRNAQYSTALTHPPGPSASAAAAIAAGATPAHAAGIMVAAAPVNATALPPMPLPPGRKWADPLATYTRALAIE